jgi:hypothetical protein
LQKFRKLNNKEQIRNKDVQLQLTPRADVLKLAMQVTNIKGANNAVLKLSLQISC